MAIKRMIWDIETSPNVGYFWKSGWKMTIGPENIIQERAIICICWKWEGKKKVYSLVWDNGDDRQMIKDFLVEAAKADELIAHNGDKFDIKWFQGQCCHYGFTPVPEYKTVDTLLIARSKFNFNSYGLDYLAKHLGCNYNKTHPGFQMWKDVMAGDNKALKKMITYCKNDCNTLEEIWHKVSPYHKPKTHVGVLMDRCRWTCPGCGDKSVSHSKLRVTTAGMRRHQMKCDNCGRYFTIPHTIYQKFRLRNK